jgi:hypothetical protein
MAAVYLCACYLHMHICVYSTDATGRGKSQTKIDALRMTVMPYSVNYTSLVREPL